MTSLVYRRRRNILIFLLLAAAIVVMDAVLSVSMYPTAFPSGWALLGLVLLLTLYNTFKKVPFLPLGASRFWLQIHIYAGLLSFVVLLVHVGYRLPNGIFEIMLAAIYLGVFVSGLMGLMISRIVPPRLATRGEEVLFERIPVLLKRLRDDVEEVVLTFTSKTDTTGVPEFYISRVKPFFERPRHFWQHLLHSSRPRRRLLLEIESQKPYLNEQEKELMRELAERVCVKDDLDYQYAMQATLKYWLFMHIPLTYGLLVFILFHMVLVFAFSGGPR